MMSVMEDHNEDFMNFCQLMIDVGQFRVYRVFEAGSRAEVAGNELSMNAFSIIDQDRDQMFYRRDQYVFSSVIDVPSVYRGEIFRYVTEGIHPGYAQLWGESDGKRAAYPVSLVDMLPKDEKHGPALTRDHGRLLTNKYNLSKEHSASIIKMRDIVGAHHSPYWPREAVEWTTRRRPRGSHSRDVIRRVVGYGCDFVCASHKGYIERDKDIEWRFSFSMAELLLIKSWSRQQRTVYGIIRVLHKMSLKTGRESHLCTYYYKNLMLWAVETKPQCFWDDVALVESVREVLMDMIRSLEIKYFHHYFIPTNNLFDHFQYTDVSDDVNALRCICKDTEIICRVVDLCRDEELLMSNRRPFAIIPQTLYNSIRLATRVNNSFSDNYTDLFCSSNHHQIHSYLRKNLTLSYELSGASSLEQTDRTASERNDKYKLSMFSRRHFEEQYASRVTGQQIGKYSIDDNVFRNITNYYMEMITLGYESWVKHFELCAVDERILKICATENKYLLYSRSESCIAEDDSFVLFNSAYITEHHGLCRHQQTGDKYTKSLTIMLFDVCPVQTVFKRTPKYLAYWRKRSPTVPMSWFINKAYTANHYYTLLSDRKTTVGICDEIIKAYNTTWGNRMFAEQGIPVLLSTQWTKMYDRNVQQILGLAALCSFVINGSDNLSIHLPVCPIQFALYLKGRCVMDTEGSESEKNTEAADEYIKHFAGDERNTFDPVCDDKHYFNYGKVALTGAMILCETESKRSVFLNAMDMYRRAFSKCASHLNKQKTTTQSQSN